MREYTKAEEVGVSLDIINHALNWCENDQEVWNLSMLSGLTTATKPESEEEVQFYDAEVKIIEEIQRLGSGDSTPYPGRWDL